VRAAKRRTGTALLPGWRSLRRKCKVQGLAVVLGWGALHTHSSADTLTNQEAMHVRLVHLRQSMCLSHDQCCVAMLVRMNECGLWYHALILARAKVAQQPYSGWCQVLPARAACCAT
jgi:hypothetical protein